MPELKPRTPEPSCEFEGYIACHITEVAPYATSKDEGLRVRLSNNSFAFFFNHPLFIEKLRKQIRMQVPEIYSEKLTELVDHAVGFNIPLIFKRRVQHLPNDNAVYWAYHLIDPTQSSEEICIRSSDTSASPSTASSSEE